MKVIESQKILRSKKIVESQNLNSHISFPEQVRRGELLDADCPSREILKRVTSRWGYWY